MSQPPELSVIIPVYNEEAILDTAVHALNRRLARRGLRFEILLAENGSIDNTVEIARRLADEIDAVEVIHTGAPNYGRALRRGIETARGEYVVCDEIDLGDMDFYDRALEELRAGADMVVGSKRHPDSDDARPWLRRQGTTVINTMLRVALDFRGTDTHGLKAFRRAQVMPVVEECTVEHHLFASELVIRAGRHDLDVREVPLRLREIRPPSVGLVHRVPGVLTDLARLVWIIRLKK